MSDTCRTLTDFFHFLKCLAHPLVEACFCHAGERSYFANKMKGINRLKAKLQVIAKEQGASSISSIKKDAIVDPWQVETRRYVSHPYKLVHDVKTGIEVPDLDSVLDGNIGPLIAARLKFQTLMS